MVRSKPKQAPSKKQSRGVDFKKIKRKIGRKLPPPKNATNVQIKSKAIVLPEQSLASDRSGLAVSKKGLTLKELLQQSSHHNPKIRKVALIGIRDLALKFRSEIKIHKLAIIQKVRERICDNDAVIREELHNLLKKVIFPILKEDLNGPLVSSIMAYVFNAMTHLSVDVRLMAFKFFDLVVLNCPSSFLLYAEKVLDNYGDILRNNQIYLQDKSKLKTALAGLVHCLSLLSSFNEKKPSYDQKTEGWKPLHAFDSKIPDKHLGISSIINKLEGLVPILISCFQELTGLIRAMPVLDAVTFDCILSLLQSINLAAEYAIYRMGFHQGLGISYNSQDMMRKTENNVLVLLKKFLEGFPIYPIHNSSEMIDDRYFILNVKITEIFFHMSKWIDDDASLMERFLIFIENALAGQICNNVRSRKMLQENYLIRLVPFIPGLVSQMMSHWKVRLLQCSPVKSYLAQEYDSMQIPLAQFFCTFIDNGDLHYGPFDKLPRDCQELASTKPPLDNMYAMLKMVVMLDSKPTRLPEEFMGTLGHSLCSYLIAAAFILVENNDEMHNQQMLMCQYFIQPCILLFIGSEKLLNLVLGLLDSAVVEYDIAPFSHSGAESMFELSNRVQAVASILIIMHKHVRLHLRLSSSRAAIKTILQKIHGLQSSKEKSMNLEERHRIRCTFDQLRTETNKLHCWNNEDLL
ncbi:hypothetical protein QJS10_CPB17g01736 [Acorus calamus]|uniref:Pre-rRNA-processing protein Ipi1 N-terminal domain-containing protein n=1 Tax=Acorus calamus TaxID=4465 RepID=A0AAV9CUN9_ACOCL|nr:hypothetical protein QJS10_CPB17g01736 [Acorus calamus]